MAELLRESVGETAGYRVRLDQKVCGFAALDRHVWAWMADRTLEWPIVPCVGWTLYARLCWAA